MYVNYALCLARWLDTVIGTYENVADTYDYTNCGYTYECSTSRIQYYLAQLPQLFSHIFPA